MTEKHEIAKSKHDYNCKYREAYVLQVIYLNYIQLKTESFLLKGTRPK